MEKDKSIKILHAENGGEYIVPYLGYSVDGFCKENNTVYEFYGCKIHAHNLCTNMEDIHILRQERNKDVYQITIERENILKKIF